MTLDQLAAHMDSLKRPIEEAPMDQRILGVYADGYTETLVWDETEQCWFGNYRLVRCNPTHFLPLPEPGPVEFEVVPVGLVEKAFREGMDVDDHSPFLESDVDDAWQGSDARALAERAYLSGLETGAEVARLEGEAE